MRATPKLFVTVDGGVGVANAVVSGSGPPSVPSRVSVVANGGCADRRCAIDWYTGEL